MCGIAGIFRFDDAPVDPELLRAMATVLGHRGPDGEGEWFGPGVALGHRRLSIIDLAGSPQPMASTDERLHVTFNGEIFNYAELRRRLRYPFRTSGDTEVVVAAFAERGPRAVDLLDGQFAFAMHDAADASVWLFRDRVGVLPLYYTVDEHRLAFASEIKALLPALREVRVDEAGLASYLEHRAVHAPRTLFAGVRKLRPGYGLHATRDGRVREAPYWEIPPVTGRRRSKEEAVAEVGHALESAVAAALVADVPVGAYLSGGVDSSLITALTVRARDGAPVETFSAGFGDPRFDELPHARTVSRKLGTTHHEVVVQPTDFEALWPALTWHRDAPLSEPADVAVFRLAELARRHVKVVLSGEGSDELFGGYPKHRADRWIAPASWLPPRLTTAGASAVERRLPASAHRVRIATRVVGAGSERARFDAWFSPFTAAERRRLLGKTPSAADGWPAPVGDRLRRMLTHDVRSWLPDNLLERGDRMSMAASLELRPPFLHRPLVELAFDLASDVKVRHGRTKWVVKEVARRYLPPEIVDRRKVGFRVPLDAWFREGLRDLAHDLLLSPTSFASQMLDRRAVGALLESHQRGASNEEMRIWTLLGLEIWHRTFLSPDRAPLVP